jgi:hypothetical protein
MPSGSRARRPAAPALTVVLALAVATSVTACANPAPTASPTSSDAIGRFQAMMSAPDRNLVAGLRGSYTLTADEVYPLWGALADDGADTRMLTAIETALGIEAWEEVRVGDTTSSRRGTGAWQEVVTSDVGAGLAETLGSMAALEDLGPESVDGQELRHVRSSIALGPDELGLDDATPGDPATLDAWLAEDGTPITMRITSGPLTVDLEDIRFGVAADVQAPGELAVLQSPALRYALVLPQGTEITERGTSGHLIGLDGAYVITYCAGGSMQLPGWVTEGTTFYSGLWGAEPEAAESLTIESATGAVPATLSTWHGTAEGQDAYIMDLAVVADGVACDIQWFSPPGNEAADRARFEQLLAGFRLGG